MITDLDAWLDMHRVGEPDDKSHRALTGTVSASEAHAAGANRVYGLAMDLSQRAHDAWGPSPEQQAEAVGLYNAAEQALMAACQHTFLQLVTSDCLGQA